MKSESHTIIISMRRRLELRLGSWCRDVVGPTLSMCHCLSLLIRQYNQIKLVVGWQWPMAAIGPTLAGLAQPTIEARVSYLHFDQFFSLLHEG